MDLSKLPRLSETKPGDVPAQPPETPATATPAEPVPPARLVDQQSRDLATGAEVWISLAIGVILLLAFPRLPQYLFARSSFTWTFTDATGAPLEYLQTAYFWVDLGLATFALTLVLEALAFAFARRPLLVMVALIVTIAVALFNVAVLVKIIPDVGFQIIPALAAAFGIYAAMYQWRLLRALRED